MNRIIDIRLNKYHQFGHQAGCISYLISELDLIDRFSIVQDDSGYEIHEVLAFEKKFLLQAILATREPAHILTIYRTNSILLGNVGQLGQRKVLGIDLGSEEISVESIAFSMKK